MSRQEELLQRMEQSWFGKRPLIVPLSAADAVRSPIDWMSNFPAFPFIDGSSLETMKAVKNYYSDDEIAEVVRDSGLYMLETAYSINKKVNSKRHVGNLAGVANNRFSRVAASRNHEDLLQASRLTNNFYLNTPYLRSEINRSGVNFSGPLDFQNSLRDLERENRTWLEELLEQLTSRFRNATGSLRERFRRAVRKIERVLSGRSLEEVERVARSLQLSPRLIPSPAVETVSGISSFMVRDFLFKNPGTFPVQGIPSIINTTGAIVLKNLGTTGISTTGAEGFAYLAASNMSTNIQMLPKIFTSAGTFCGPWGFLATCASFAIAAAVLVTLAIKLSTKVKVGDIFYIIGINPNATHMLYSSTSGGTQEELLQSFSEYKQELERESGADYSECYGFSFDRDENRQLCVNNGAIAVPLKDEQAAILWSRLKNKINWWE